MHITASSHRHLCTRDKNILQREALLLQSSSASMCMVQQVYQISAHLVLRVWGFFGSLPCKSLTSSVRMLPAKPCINLEVLWKKWKLLPIWKHSCKTVMISQELSSNIQKHTAVLRYFLSHKIKHRVAFSIYFVNFHV